MRRWRRPGSLASRRANLPNRFERWCGEGSTSRSSPEHRTSSVGYNHRSIAPQRSLSMHVTAIIAAAGEGRRLGAPVPKQLLDIGGRSILEHSVAAFTSHGRVNDVIVVLPPALAAEPPDWLAAAMRSPSVRVVAGGDRRQDSVANAFDRVASTSDVVLVHDAARPFVTTDLISR